MGQSLINKGQTSNNLEAKVETILREYDYVSSAILMYRQLQMQAIGIGVVLYSSGSALIAATKENDQVVTLINSLAAIAPWPILLLILSFYVMDVRIKRAGSYIDQTLNVKLNQLLDMDHVGWERSPSIHLKYLDKIFANSAPFILILALPAILISVWFLVFSDVKIGFLILTNILGLILLVPTTVLTILVSYSYEKR